MKTYVSLGSNVQPYHHIPLALKAIQKIFPIHKKSSIYETDPYGPAGDNPFLNMVIVLEATEFRSVLERKLRLIEDEFGRKRKEENKYAPRTIDIDLLPHEGYQEFPFVMIPLAEIAPDEIDGLTGKKFKELAEGLKDQAQKYKVVELPIST